MGLEKLKAIVVDDEQASRDTLSTYIEKYCPDVLVVATAESASQGLEMIEKFTPDIVFLDVEMPYGNAFDLLEQVKEVNFETVFVTAYSDYAIKALNFSASYYILKPVDIEELILAVEKIKASRTKNDDELHSRILMENIKTANKQLHKIVLPLIDGFEVVQVKDIIHCKANDNFTNFYFTNRKMQVICRTLKFYENLLSDFEFLRVHKSHLVNLQHVVKYKKGKGGQLILTDKSEIEVSATRKQELLNRF